MGVGVLADLQPSPESGEPVAQVQAVTATVRDNAKQPVLSKNAQKKAAKQER